MSPYVSLGKQTKLKNMRPFEFCLLSTYSILKVKRFKFTFYYFSLVLRVFSSTFQLQVTVGVHFKQEMRIEQCGAITFYKILLFNSKKENELIFSTLHQA